MNTNRLKPKLAACNAEMMSISRQLTQTWQTIDTGCHKLYVLGEMRVFGRCPRQGQQGH